MLARLFRLIWGADVERALRPVLGVMLVGSLAFSAGWSFMGIWAIEELGASGSQLGVAFLVGAAVASVSGYLGGHASDHLGRRPLILLGWGGEALFILTFLAAGDRVYVGLALVALAGLFGSVGSAATLAMIADLVRPARHEEAYASVRVANNFGVILGPPIGGVLLLVGDWEALFVGVSALASAGFLVAARFLPRRGEYAPDAPPERGSLAVIRNDRAFLLFLASGALAYLVYVAYETVLPISLVDTHGVEPATWGFLLVINPALVTFFQLRVTRWTAGIAPAPKLAAAMLLMGFPFLLLSATSALPVVAFILVVFVIGEMLWVPTSQAVIAALAPEDVRGAYMGAFGTTGAVGFALAPFAGLQIRDGLGDTAMWGFFTLLSVVAAVVAVFACRVALGARGAAAPLPAADPTV